MKILHSIILTISAVGLLLLPAMCIMYMPDVSNAMGCILGGVIFACLIALDGVIKTIARELKKESSRTE